MASRFLIMMPLRLKIQCYGVTKKIKAAQIIIALADN